MQIDFLAGKAARLDILLREKAPQLSRSRLQKAVREGCCLVDGQIIRQPAMKVCSGAHISLLLPEENIFLSEGTGELDILYQDDCVAILNKPAGIAVHPCPSCKEETLAHRLVAAFPQLASIGGERPGIVHRLDKDTSGLILIALTEKCRLALVKEFAQRKISKKYLALVAGSPPATGECEDPIGRHPTLKTRMAIVPVSRGGREAYTSWKVLWHSEKFSLLEISIKSGRTHQIRVHMAHMGYPLIGDKTYSPGPIAAKADRQLLHAWQLSFMHPARSEEMHFCVPPPADFFSGLMTGQRSLHLVVTGNQGCGKSAFCHELQSLGLPVTSADAIVAGLYGSKGAGAEWIGSRVGEDCLNSDGSVNKTALLRQMEQKPWLKKELEDAIHSLVQQKIEDFWQAHKDAEICCAEIPLYFESKLRERLLPIPFVLGISCPQEIRFERIAHNRHWTREKIATLESWQWPEAKKMRACDAVITNDGTQTALQAAAREFVEKLRRKRQCDKEELLQTLKALCACPKKPS